MPSVVGTNWSDGEIALVVGEYFQMLELDLKSLTFIKIDRYRALSSITGRSTKSIERKFQNISAIMDVLGRQWIRGLAPLRNFQKSLAVEVEKKLLSESREFLEYSAPLLTNHMSENINLFIEQAPTPSVESQLPEYMKRLVRKFDPTIRDLRNRALGKAGEEVVLHHERSQLVAIGRSDLANKVRWVADLDGDGAGYDILSFDDRGDERYLEVKTTNGHNRTPFYMTKNEADVAEEKGVRYKILRIFDFSQTPKAFEIIPPFKGKILLEANTFKASFG